MSSNVAYQRYTEAVLTRRISDAHDQKGFGRCGLIVLVTAALCVGMASGAAMRHLVQPPPEVLQTNASAVVVRTVVLTFFGPEYHPWQAAALAAGDDAVMLDGPTEEKLLFFRLSGALVVCTGMGPRVSSAAVTAIGYDGRFDVRRALWLVAGVAGADPLMTSVGSAVWADHIVDMAVSYYVDRREQGFDPSWATGWIPLTCAAPFCRGGGSPGEAKEGEVAVSLSKPLVDWAVGLTANITLPDSDPLRDMRAPFGEAGFTSAATPPQMLRGDTLSGATVWVGYKASEWARQWVPYWTQGRGRFVTTAMEDSGVASALRLLERSERANTSRLLSLRAVANYCTQPPGVSIASFLEGVAPADTGGEGDDTIWNPGYDPVTLIAADHAFLIASAVANAESPA